MRPVRKVIKEKRGQALVELALVLPLLILLIIGMMEFGRVFHSYLLITNAAREGARLGVIEPTNTGAITGTVTTQLAAALAAGPADYSVTVTYPYITYPFSDTEQVRVEVSYRFRPVTLLLSRIIDGGSGAGFTLRAQSTMGVEK